MDENKSRREQSSQRAQSAADKLRALREKTSQALDDHRRRLGSIENELSQKVKQLAEEFDATAPTPSKSAGEYEAEIASLRTQLDEGQQKHAKFVEQLVAARKELEAFEAAPCTACEEAGRELVAVRSELAKSQLALAEAETQHAAERARHEKFAEQLATARSAIRDLESSIDERVASLRAELDVAQAETAAAQAKTTEAQAACAAAAAERDDLAKQFEALARDLELLHDQCTAENESAAAAQEQLTLALAEKEMLSSELVAALAGQQAEQSRVAGHAELVKQHESAAAELRKKLADAMVEHTILAKSADELKARLAAAETGRDELAREKESLAAATTAKQAQLETDLSVELTRCDDLQTRLTASEKLAAEVPTLRRQLSEATEGLAEERGGVQQAAAQMLELSSQLATVQSERDAVLEERDAATAERDAALEATQRDQEQIAALRDGLKEAEKELGRLADALKRQPALEEVQQKFELALADVQKLKRENETLREELSQRPESNDDDSQELMALRAERDDLAARVVALENSTAAPADGDVQQQLDDLQRRFEMAVDDVRQLKKENAELKEKGGAAGAKSGGGAGGGKGDWAAQKAQLLAMLAEEDDGGTIGVQRKAERATIQETVATTDRAIAEKDRELEELRAMVAAGGGGGAPPVPSTEAILDADETVGAERQRLAGLQSEWEQKLRDAELEFSVMRAKLAREQAALKEKMLEAEISAGQAEADTSGKPRRGWMDALGLREEKK